MNFFQDELDSERLQFQSKLYTELGRFLIGARLTVATAETLTQGLMGYILGTLPNQDQFYRGSIVCNHQLVKLRLGGISALTLKEKGEASPDAALELARTCQRLTKADLCIAHTGIIGRDIKTVPVLCTASVYLACVLNQTEKVQLLQFQGTQGVIRHHIVTAACGFLRQWLKNTVTESEPVEMVHK